MNLKDFVERWTATQAAERANKDAFLIEFCEVLGVEKPNPKTGDFETDDYVFERDAILIHSEGRDTVGWMDLYKKGCFLLEAKQGSNEGSKKLGTARRDTPAWNIAMGDAYGQALGYAKTLDDPPPFIITCDIGYCFDLYACFDGSGAYRPFPTARANRIFLPSLEQHLPTFKAIFEAPFSLDPSKKAAKVTREVAGHLAALAVELEKAKHPPEEVAKFLMRCIFTMFVEDIGLLPDELFTKAIEKDWINEPENFKENVETLWSAMNKGDKFGFVGKLLKFNGGLFAEPTALPLQTEHLFILLLAAKCDWSEVEPAIFGTLLERALDPRERHRIGAHYTPRAYVERLVRPTVEEPLRSDWDLVKGEVRQLVEAEKIEPARKLVRAFHQKLCATRVLDPACGSGNFLYVTLDLFKRLEGEVLRLLSDLGESKGYLDLEGTRVTPKQFLGIEVKPWAKEIAELVLWIGYLQWHYRTRGRVAPPEPVLHDYKNIECRDALIDYDSRVPLLNEAGEVVTRWDGQTQRLHPATGEAVPDATAVVPVFRYVGARRAEWHAAEYIVGNPPFVGNKRMRQALGDAYVDAVRSVHDDVPETSDFVMYWWNKAAQLARTGKIRQFGFITTNSITQTFNRKVVQPFLSPPTPLSVVFAIPDHPWVDSADGADVRIAMTVAVAGDSRGRLLTVTREQERDDDHPLVDLNERRGKIAANLSVGAAVGVAKPLSANEGLSFQGVILVGEGFRLQREDLVRLGLAPDRLPPVVRRYLIGKDIVQSPKERFVIDFFGLTEEEARKTYPALYQVVHERVRPHRLENRDAQRKARWWLFGRSNENMRAALKGLPRYIATVETSKHKPFVFLPCDVCPDHKLYVVATEDSLILGVLNSRPHQVWALAAGGRLGIGNDPTWTNSTCFLPFPFPPSTQLDDRIRELAEQLDAHRKKQQSEYPTLTLTGMYNVLAKLRSGEPLSAKEQVVNEQGLCAVLKQIHDDLDRAVFAAYGWAVNLSDEQVRENLVGLNRARADEEESGQVRWIRPALQNPAGVEGSTQIALPVASSKKKRDPRASVNKLPWSSKLPDRIAAVRELLTSVPRAWTLKDTTEAFSRANDVDVELVLESLAALGLVVAYNSGSERRWRGAVSKVTT